MRGPLSRWLWSGVFDLDLRPMEVASATEPEADLLSSAEGALQHLQRLIDVAEQRAERAGKPSPTQDADRDLRRFAKGVLPVLDAMDRVLEFGEQQENQSEELTNWLKAVQGVLTRLERALEQIGLQRINSVGMEVDLDVHDVVATQPSVEYPENTVISEQQKGYYFRGRLLRDARVVVAMPGAPG